MITRRGLLLGTGGFALGLAGCALLPTDPESGGWSSPTCVARSSLDREARLSGARFVYDVTGDATSFSFEPAFFGQLTRWLEGFVDTTGIATPTQVWTYGSWIDGGTSCDSWHHAGRAFDLSRLRVGSRFVVSCRYDLWGESEDLDLLRRRYWATVASLHRDFGTVLTYLYNPTHHNHIHVDNGQSGAEPSRFRTRSRAQVQAVQAISTYLWDAPVELTGSWDGATREAVATVLDRTGGDDLTDPEAWHSFCAASAARYPA